jgi:hypothetical protein
MKAKRKVTPEQLFQVSHLCLDELRPKIAKMSGKDLCICAAILLDKAQQISRPYWKRRMSPNDPSSATRPGGGAA